MIPSDNDISTTEMIASDPYNWTTDKVLHEFCTEAATPTQAFPASARRLKKPATFAIFVKEHGIQGSEIVKSLGHKADESLSRLYTQNEHKDREIILEAIGRLQAQHAYISAEAATMDQSRSDDQRLIAKLDQQVAALNLSLISLRELCRKECGESSSECHGIHGWNIRNEYKKYYLDSSIPERWDYGRDNYKHEVSSMFDGGARMRDIHTRVASEKRSALAENITATQPAENDSLRESKATAIQMFEAQVPTEDIQAFLKQKNEDAKVGLSGEQRAVADQLAAAKSKGEQYEIYKQYHSSLQPADQLEADWKDRLGRMYSEHAPLPTILDFSNRYIEDRRARAVANANEIRNLKEKIDENRMAWRAHKRRITAKDEKKAAKAAEKRASYIALNTYPCAAANCQEQAKPLLDQDSSEDLGPLECPVCYLMWEKRYGERQFFCSMGCLKRNWVDHRDTHHACSAGSECEENEYQVGDGDGICDECDREHSVMTYWCSQACFEKSADEHTRMHHASPQDARPLGRPSDTASVGSPRDGRTLGRPSDLTSVEGDYERMDVDPEHGMEADN